MFLRNKVTNNDILRQHYAAALVQVALNLDGDQQQALRFYYSRCGLISAEDTGILATLTSLEHAGKISWQDLGTLTEGLRQIQRLDLVKLLTKFELKRNLTVLLDFYAREKLGLDLCFRSDSVQTTATYLSTETAREGFDVGNVTSLVQWSKNTITALQAFEEAIYRSELSSPWSKLTSLIVIAGEIIVAASANGERHQTQQMMEMCFTAAEECSSRMVELGSWEEFCQHVEERFKLVRDHKDSESHPSSLLLIKKQVDDVVQKLTKSSFFR